MLRVLIDAGVRMSIDEPSVVAGKQLVTVLLEQGLPWVILIARAGVVAPSPLTDRLSETNHCAWCQSV